MKRVTRAWLQRSAIIVLMLLVVGGCSWEPERDNPADPGSGSYTGMGDFEATVTTRNGDALEGARVAVDDKQIVGYTDASGKVVITAPVGTNNLSITKTDYADATESVSVQYGTVSEITIALNGLPTLDSLYFNSVGVEDDPERPAVEYFSRLSVKPSDPDGLVDILKIEYTNPLTQELRTLEVEASVEWYQDILSFGDQPDAANQLAEMVGLPIDLVVYDKQGAQYDTTISLAGVLRYYLTDDLPDENDHEIQYDNPIFTWSEPSVTFLPYRHKFELFSEDETTLIYSAVFTNTTRIEPDINLVVNNEYHYWLTLYDTFGNSIRSLMLSFDAEDYQ